MNWLQKTATSIPKGFPVFRQISRYSSNWLFRLADYDEYRDQVEQNARGNPYPFKDWFDENGRVYLPFQSDEAGESFDQNVVNILSDEGCEVTDYRGGYCQQGKRIFRINKILNKAKSKALQEAQVKFQSGQLYDLEREQQELVKFYDGVMEEFVNSAYRSNKKESGFFIIISQNPHDVASMSTNRNWSSCMELGSGSHHKDIFCEVAEGGLVAYLVQANDRDIQNPLARIAIKRFTNKAGTSIALPENSVYGNEVPGFLDTVRGWLNSQQQIDPGFYSRKGGQYSDTFSQTQLVAPSDPEGVMRWYNGEDPSAQLSTWTVTDNMFSEVASDDPEDHQETKTFDTREEAVIYVDNRDHDDSWRNYYGGEWLEKDEETGEYVNERFTVTENAKDHRSDMKRNAIKTIIQAPRGTYPMELIKQIKADLEFSNKYGNYRMSSLIKDFAEKYPELMDANDYFQMGQRAYRKYINDLPDGPQKDQLKQEEMTTAMGYLDNPDQLVTEDEQAQSMLQNLRTVTDTNSRVQLNDGVSLRFSCEFQDKVLEPLQDLFKPLPEPAIRKLVDFAENIDHLGLSDNNSPIPNRNKKYDEQITSGIVHVIGMSGADTPTVQRFYQNLISSPLYGDNHKGRGNNRSINVETLGSWIAHLGENGQQFIPWAQQKLQEEQEYYATLQVGEKPTHWGGDHYERTSKKNIERYLYIIDALQSGTGRSTKYRFF